MICSQDVWLVDMVRLVADSPGDVEHALPLAVQVRFDHEVNRFESFADGVALSDFRETVLRRWGCFRPSKRPVWLGLYF